MSFWTKSEKLPPALVRLLAVGTNHRPLTDDEIAQASDLQPFQVFTISQALDWTGIDLPTMRKFLVGCRIDFENRAHMARVHDYLRKAPTWKYLRMSPNWATFYQPLMMKYLKQRKGKQ